LLVSPLSKGLFHRALAESGGARAAIRHLREKWYGKEPMEAVGEYVEKTLKCDQAENPLAAMRAKSPAEILKAADAAKSHFGGEISAPIVDGWVLPDDPAVLFEEGKSHDVPFITGSNADELASLISDYIVRAEYRDDADDIFKLFPGDARKRAATVSIFTATARADAIAMSRHTSKAFLYQFSRVPRPWRFMGAFHASEIVYVFGNFDPKMKFEPKDRELSAMMMAYWTNFAKTGDPNAPGLPRWPAYDANSDQHMDFGDTVQAEAGLEKAACDGIDRIRQERMNKRKGS
jgi:para-nitrobenzyl esterase